VKPQRAAASVDIGPHGYNIKDPAGGAIDPPPACRPGSSLSAARPGEDRAPVCACKVLSFKKTFDISLLWKMIPVVEGGD
jgi:hypothetical protein